VETKAGEVRVSEIGGREEETRRKGPEEERERTMEVKKVTEEWEI